MSIPAAAFSKAVFITSDIFRETAYRPDHSLYIPRVGSTEDLCRAMGWLPDEQRIACGPAPLEWLQRVHTPEYIAALRQAERDQRLPPEMAKRFNLGYVHHSSVTPQNPIFQNMFKRHGTAAGGSLLAADLVQKYRFVFHPGGGSHHALRDKANAFCYLNDIAICMLRLLDNGYQRIAYVDLDAHHPDGVQEFFAEEERVHTFSIHRHHQSLSTGALDDKGLNGYARNIPVPPKLNDREFKFLMKEALFPQITTYKPKIIVLQCGADSLASDPMGQLNLTNQAYWRTIEAMKGFGLPMIVLGGGGYNPHGVARCWAGIWATLAGYDPASVITETARQVLAALPKSGSKFDAHWLETIVDPEQQESAVRQEIKELAQNALAAWLSPLKQATKRPDLAP